MSSGNLDFDIFCMKICPVQNLPESPIQEMQANLNHRNALTFAWCTKAFFWVMKLYVQSSVNMKMPTLKKGLSGVTHFGVFGRLHLCFSCSMGPKWLNSFFTHLDILNYRGSDRSYHNPEFDTYFTMSLVQLFYSYEVSHNDN